MKTGFYAQFENGVCVGVHHKDSRSRKGFKGIEHPITVEERDALAGIPFHRYELVNGKLEARPEWVQTSAKEKRPLTAIDWRLVASHLAAAGAGVTAGTYFWG